MPSPLADRLRPKTLDEVVGQRHLLAPGRVLRRIVESGQIPNLIFYGPSGVGKTTVARIIAGETKKALRRLNGTTASTADIKAVVEERDTIAGMGGILLYLDEIQYLNKKQQQTLLEYIEDGSVTLIASTTENPYFYVYNAILSRSTVFEFKPVEPEEVRRAVERAFRMADELSGLSTTVGEGVAEYLSSACGGDVRKALNAVEALSSAAGAADGLVTLEDAREVAQRSAMRYDRDGDAHYDILSAFQKSVRGSDENAALHYLARLLEAGDLISPCRRLLVMASEDIGLAYPLAAAVVKSCCDSAMQLGLPEARLPLAEAVILLCTAPKSNSAIMAIDAAMEDVRNGKTGEIPAHLRDGHYEGAQKLGHAQGYRYAHNFPGGWVEQQYLPDELKDAVYYHFGENKTEQAALEYRKKQRAGRGKQY
ncbi:MAG TPA: replication-associated recombination protein A [Candidatus Fimivivens faecavium]|nr:replication-associated recombination protein A [Candidatus Fimivivens faecavium]